jgi:hypothetical protein
VKVDDGATQADYDRVQKCREALLEAHHRAVLEYIARCALDEDDLFPYRGALSGDYYLEGRESYYRQDGELRISIQARCLGVRPHHSRNKPRDYLGIDIVLQFHPETGTFTTFYTGGQVI